MALVKEAQRALPKLPKTKVKGSGQGTGNCQSQPPVNLSPGPRDPNVFLCLQPFLTAKTISVSQVLDSAPVEEIVSEVVAPVEDRNLSQDASMDTTQPEPPTGELFWGAQLEALMAKGQISVTKMAPTADLEPVESSTPQGLLQLTYETSSKDLPPSQQDSWGLYDSW